MFLFYVFIMEKLKFIFVFKMWLNYKYKVILDWFGYSILFFGLYL